MFEWIVKFWIIYSLSIRILDIFRWVKHYRTVSTLFRNKSCPRNQNSEADTRFSSIGFFVAVSVWAGAGLIPNVFKKIINYYSLIYRKIFSTYGNQ